MVNTNLKEYINSTYDIRRLYEDVMGKSPSLGKCFCPFHLNVHTPAAKVYGNTLKCFGLCNRIFTPFDFLERFFPSELELVKKSVILPSLKEKSGKKFIQYNFNESWKTNLLNLLK